MRRGSETIVASSSSCALTAKVTRCRSPRAVGAACADREASSPDKRWSNIVNLGRDWLEFKPSHDVLVFVRNHTLLGPGDLPDLIIGGWVKSTAADIHRDYSPGASHWIVHHREWMASDDLHRNDADYAVLAKRMDAVLTRLGLKSNPRRFLDHNHKVFRRS